VGDGLECEGAWGRELTEQSFAGSQEQWVDEEADLVDQVLGEQFPAEYPAAQYRDVPFGCRF
jgi:hypothetical protein